MNRNTFKGGQVGFTLIELVMALGVSVIILAAVGYTVVQVFNINTRNTNHMTAVREVQSVGSWFSRDAVQAPYDVGATPPWITPQSGTSSSLLLQWLDSDNLLVRHTSNIVWNQSTGTIVRTFDNQTSSIAQHITSAIFTVTPVTLANDVTIISKVTVDVTAKVTTRGITGTETRTYEISPRPGQAQ